MQEIFKKLGIELVLFDLDDTLFYTQEFFMLYINQVIAKFAKITNIEFEDFSKVWLQCYLVARDIHHVDPDNVWDLTLDNLGRIFPAIDTAQKSSAREVLFKIYEHQDIRVKPGVIEFLKFLQDCKIPFDVVTNADKEWTKLKLKATGLDQYISIDNDYSIVPPTIKKCIDHWRKAIIYNDCQPENVMIFGDNFTADVEPGIRLKALSIHIHDSSNFSEHNRGHNGIDPSQFITISSFSMPELEIKFQEFLQSREAKLPSVK